MHDVVDTVRVVAFIVAWLEGTVPVGYAVLVGGFEKSCARVEFGRVVRFSSDGVVLFAVCSSGWMSSERSLPGESVERLTCSAIRLWRERRKATVLRLAIWQEPCLSIGSASAQTGHTKEMAESW